MPSLDYHFQSKQNWKNDYAITNKSVSKFGFFDLQYLAVLPSS